MHYHQLEHNVFLLLNGIYMLPLSAYCGGVGSKTGLYLVDGEIRKLSPRECARVQGYENKLNVA